MRLTEEREAKGLTQKEVADRIGITQASLSMIERGERVGSDKTKIKLSKLYGKTIDYLFFEGKITKRDWMKTYRYKKEDINNEPMNKWTRVIIQTNEKNPKPIAIMTNDNYEVAKGFVIRLLPAKEK